MADKAADPPAARPRRQLHGRERSGVRGGGAEARRRPVAQHRWPVQHQPGGIHRRADRRLRGHRPVRRGGEGKPVRDARRGSRLRPQLDQAARPPRQARALVRGRAPLHQRAQHLRAGAGHPRQERAGKRPAARRPAARHRALVPARSCSTASKARTPAAHSTPGTPARRCSPMAPSSGAAKAR